MINIQLKPQKENTYCPLCFSIVTKASFDKHLDEKHPRNGYVAKKNVPLSIIQHALDYLCPDCYLTYEDLEKLKKHFNLVHHFSIREEEIPEEKPAVRTPEPPKKTSREPRVFVASELSKQPIEKSINDFTLYVYDSLTPTRCIGGTYHSAENVTLERIAIRLQSSRWGSCSANGNLNFNCLLVLMPPEVLDSVVVHELCHRRHMNHSKEFYAEIDRVFPDYRRWNKWLKDNGGVYLKRCGKK